MARLELRGIDKTYPGSIPAARGVDLTVEDGELFVIVGPSGSGKSTLLRLVAGLESLDQGEIRLDGVRIDRLSPVDRGVAMVFQDQVLYPHLNVFENIAFGLRARRVPKSEVDERVRTTAQVLGLTDCLERLPGTLSGGQRRRASLGRALVLRPKLFLFDEPFSGLDAPLRASTRSELVDLKRKLGATMVLVTHDQSEALALGDRVAVVDGGRVVQVSRPLELYERPKTRFVGRFIGQPAMNFLACLVAKEEDSLVIRNVGFDDHLKWTIPLSESWVAPLSDRGLPRVELGVRPEHVVVRPMESGTVPDQFSTRVKRLEEAGYETLAALEFGSEELIARLPSHTTFRPGQMVRVSFEMERASWFDPTTGERIE